MEESLGYGEFIRWMVAASSIHKRNHRTNSKKCLALLNLNQNEL